MQVRVGDVFFEHVAGIPNRDRKYFVVVVAVEPIRLIVINTINAVQRLGNVELRYTQVHAKKVDCPFLKYDSWISCNELFGGFTVPELDALVLSNRRRCQLSTEYLHAIAAAVESAPTVPEKQKRRVREAIAAELQIREMLS